MRVGTLIKKLSKLDPKLDVFINYGFEVMRSPDKISVEDAPDDYPEDWNMPKKWVEFYLDD